MGDDDYTDEEKEILGMETPEDAEPEESAAEDVREDAGESSQTAETEEAGEGVKWLTSYDEAVRLAEDKGRPIMIDFHADWCGWCKRLDEDTYVDPGVLSKSSGFIGLKVDTDVDGAIASRFGIRGLPTILFIDHKGAEIHRVVGYRRAQQFMDEMDTALRAFESRRGG